MDHEGYYYFYRIHNTRTLIKTTSDGVILSELEIPYSLNDLWDPEMMLRLSDDGTIYVATALPDDFVIWKIVME